MNKPTKHVCRKANNQIITALRTIHGHHNVRIISQTE
jgi:hypothetical protein